VTLNSVVKIDSSVLELADMPAGYQATRQKRNDKWLIEKILYSESDLEEMDD